MTESKRIFLTGAAGFVGFHLAAALRCRGDLVVGFDNFNDYYDPALKRARSAELEKLGVEVVEGDLCDKPLLDQKIEEFSPTHIVHMAAQAGVRYSLDNPAAYVRSNLEGFVNILEACRDCGASLIYASSSSVYGLSEKAPFGESDRADHPVSLYGATKKANEVLAFSYSETFGVHATGLRFFTVYGPWGRPDMAYFKFAEAIFEGKTIDVYNGGRLSRDFTYIDDVVQGAVAAIDLGAKYEIFNLGNHRPVALMRFIEILEEACGKKADKRMLPMQPGDVFATCADIEKSREKLGYEPKTPLEAGIPEFVNWYRSCMAGDFA